MNLFFKVLITVIPFLLYENQSWEDRVISYDGMTELMWAIQEGVSVEEIHYYIKQGAKVNAICADSTHYYKPVLRYALDRKNDSEAMAIIRALLVAGANPNQCTYNRVLDPTLYGFMSLISYAVIYSSPEVVSLFIEYGADVNLTLDEGLGSRKSAVMYAKDLDKEKVLVLNSIYIDE